MCLIRRLDHVAIAVPSTDETVVVDELGVRLSYVDAGNAWIQLVQPVGPQARELDDWIRGTGGGLHHLDSARTV